MSLRQEFEKSDSYNEFCHNLEWNNGVGRYKDVKTQHEYQLWCDGWQACAERKDKEIEALRGFAEPSFILSVYNRGYHAGHNATVEGRYIHIYAQDMGTYHDDILDEITDGLLTGETE